MQQNKVPRTYIFTKKTYQDQRDDGSDSLSLILDNEQAQQLIDELGKALAEGKGRVKFSAYTNDRQSEDTGAYFKSTSISVTAYEQKPQSRGGNQRGQGGNQNRRPQGRTGYNNNNNGGGSGKVGGTPQKASAPTEPVKNNLGGHASDDIPF
ncbi:single-stranded DNA-binding protein [Caudoviricetes sp.]|nr:single-stranded DNA-binding protein [Caudoviricetes sp.]UOF79132.1 single-stranded DNA-binding protein [Caudoviricetes sp.]